MNTVKEIVEQIDGFGDHLEVVTVLVDGTVETKLDIASIDFVNGNVLIELVKQGE